MLELAQDVATIANLDYYVSQVCDASTKRQLQSIAKTAFHGACNGQPAETTIRSLLADLDELQRNRQHEAVTLFLASIERRPIEWLWPDRIPLGKITLLYGKPDLGKSLVTLSIAAAVTTGAPWPENHQVVQPIGGVVLLSAEDDFEDTICPRLDALNADSNRIVTIPKFTNIAHDIDLLANAIVRVQDCRLVILDSINDYTGKTDNNANAEVRAVLTPLRKLSAEKRVAVLAMTHERKSGGGRQLITRLALSHSRQLPVPHGS